MLQGEEKFFYFFMSGFLEYVGFYMGRDAGSRSIPLHLPGELELEAAIRCWISEDLQS